MSSGMVKEEKPDIRLKNGLKILKENSCNEELLLGLARVANLSFSP